ncbi:protealysin inhibitor emfourin [Peribacillus kribbensis]|uniref:protealysin inhibitor emfourin n=1 Tax=Peribacillus kribbensis TaxID=356658 RepID=UPI00041FB584|nr:protealysin inhibitor emfourin [Peribacillus kribbensis]
MKIRFLTSGGIANLHLAYETELEQLPEEKAEKLKQLLEDADVNSLAASLTSKAFGGNDAFTYQLELIGEAETSCLVYTDVTAPEQLRPLLDYLRDLAIEEKLSD